MFTDLVTKTKKVGRSTNRLTVHSAKIMADIPNFVNVQPQIQVGSVVFGA